MPRLPSSSTPPEGSSIRRSRRIAIGHRSTPSTRLSLFACLFVVLTSLLAADRAPTLGPPHQEEVPRFFEVEGSRMQAPSDPLLELGQEFTLEAWIYVDSYPQAWGQIAGRSGSCWEALLILWPHGGVAAGVTSAGETTFAGSPGPVPLGQWVHVAGVQTSEELRVLVDGAVVGVQPAAGVPGTACTDPFGVGMGYSGAIAQVRVWNRALDASEIQTLAGQYASGAEAGLIAYWPLDDGDFSQVGHDLGPYDLDLIAGGQADEDSGDPGWLPRWALHDGPFFVQRESTASSSQTWGVLVDFDSDDDLDYVRQGLVENEDLVNEHPFYESPAPSPVTAFRNDGGGVLAEDGNVMVDDVQIVGGRRWEVADFDGDGRDDVWFVDHGPDPLPEPDPGQYPWPGMSQTLLMQTTDGRLSSEPWRVPQAVVYMHSAAAGDIDGDDDVDLFSGGTTDDGAECRSGDPLQSDYACPGFWINDGSGTFSDDRSRLPGAYLRAEIVSLDGELVDVDRDGDLDLFLGLGGLPPDPTPTRDALLLNDGDGDFVDAPPSALPPRPGSNYSSIDVISGDVDGDGWPDLFVSGYDDTFTEGFVQLLLNEGDGTFTDATDRLPPSADGIARGMALGDLNGDGLPELMLFGYPQRTRAYLNRHGTFEQIPAGIFGFNGFDVAVHAADLDGDSDVDLLADSGGGQFAVYENVRPYPSLLFMDGFESGDPSAWN